MLVITIEQQSAAFIVRQRYRNAVRIHDGCDVFTELRVFIDDQNAAACQRLLTHTLIHFRIGQIQIQARMLATLVYRQHGLRTERGQQQLTFIDNIVQHIENFAPADRTWHDREVKFQLSFSDQQYRLCFPRMQVRQQGHCRQIAGIDDVHVRVLNTAGKQAGIAIALFTRYCEHVAKGFFFFRGKTEESNRDGRCFCCHRLSSYALQLQ